MFVQSSEANSASRGRRGRGLNVKNKKINGENYNGFGTVKRGRFWKNNYKIIKIENCEVYNIYE